MTITQPLLLFMLGAPIFLELSRKGKLGCDIWLVHLTGEEFPADCLGARHLSQRLVEGNLKVTLENGRLHDLSKIRIQGLYVLDMWHTTMTTISTYFQMAPGQGPSRFGWPINLI